MIRLTIDNKPVEVAEGTTILKAARQAGIHKDGYPPAL